MDASRFQKVGCFTGAGRFHRRGPGRCGGLHGLPVQHQQSARNARAFFGNDILVNAGNPNLASAEGMVRHEIAILKNFHANIIVPNPHLQLPAGTPDARSK